MRYSIEPLIPEIEKTLGRKLHFIPDCIGDAVTRGLDALPENDLLFSKMKQKMASRKWKPLKELPGSIKEKTRKVNETIWYTE